MRALVVAWTIVISGCAGGGQRQAPPPEAKQPPPKPAEAPGCEDAVEAATRKVEQLSDPAEVAAAVHECIHEPWSAEARTCVASARDQPAFLVCVPQHRWNTMSHELEVTSIDPAQGDARGGTYVRVRGNRFTNNGSRATRVYFGSRAGTVIRVSSDHEMIVEAPAGTPGETVDVTVIFEPGGAVHLPRAFSFVDKP